MIFRIASLSQAMLVYSQAADNIKNYEQGTLELRPGCNLLQSLEEMLNGTSFR